MSKLFTQFLVSLEDPCMALKNSVEQYAVGVWTQYQQLAADQKARVKTPNPALLTYNYAPFMELLLKEIFSDQASGDPVAQVAISTQQLVQDGVPRPLAEQLASQIFQVTLDALSSAIPTLTFGAPNGFDYALCNEFDLMIFFHHQEERVSDDH